MEAGELLIDAGHRIEANTMRHPSRQSAGSSSPSASFCRNAPASSGQRAGTAPLARGGDIPARQHVSECVVVTSSWYSSGPMTWRICRLPSRPLRLGMPRTGPYPVNLRADAKAEIVVAGRAIVLPHCNHPESIDSRSQPGEKLRLLGCEFFR